MLYCCLSIYLDGSMMNAPAMQTNLENDFQMLSQKVSEQNDAKLGL